MGVVSFGFPDARKKNRIAQFKWITIAGIPLVAILYQVYVPPFFSWLAHVEMPLLVAVYFALMRRSPVLGVLSGAGIGLAQDALSSNPLGMFGLAKTTVGYLVASASLRVDVDRARVRLALAFVFYVFHQWLYWFIGSPLLGQPLAFSFAETLGVGAVNALLAVPLYRILDKLKVPD
jgi:rod shape-determining protein MreD